MEDTASYAAWITTSPFGLPLTAPVYLQKILARCYQHDRSRPLFFLVGKTLGRELMPRLCPKPHSPINQEVASAPLQPIPTLPAGR